MSKRDVGYARVSHKEQNEARQIIALGQAGIDYKDIYLDKQSGKDFDRPSYQQMVKELQEGDCLFVLSIDRLGRNYEDITQQWRRITKDIRADIVVLDMPILDTRKEKNLMGAFISDIVLYILSFVAESERTNIRARQAAGIAAARERGVRFGRAKKEVTPKFLEAYQRYKARIITGGMAANYCDMGRSTFYRMVKELEMDPHPRP